MPPRSPGRPKAANPKDVRVTVRLTEEQADGLCRMARTDSLSQAIRTAIEAYIGRLGGVYHLPDTERAMVQRELRKAKRAGLTEDATLLEAFDLDEPSEPAAVEVIDAATGRVVGTVRVERVTSAAREMPSPPMERRTFGVEATADGEETPYLT